MGLIAILCTIPSAQAAPTGSVCLNLADIDHTEVLDDQTVLFHMRDAAVWENVLPEPCRGLKAKDGFEFSSGEPKICGNIDLIYILNSDSACALGSFELYRDGPAQ